MRRVVCVSCGLAPGCVAVAGTLVGHNEYIIAPTHTSPSPMAWGGQQIVCVVLIILLTIAVVAAYRRHIRTCMRHRQSRCVVLALRFVCDVD